MDAVEFFKEQARMCKSFRNCANCLLRFLQCQRYTLGDHTELVVSIVEAWSKAHPVQTNAQKFEEVFGLPAHCQVDQHAQWWDEPYKVE